MKRDEVEQEWTAAVSGYSALSDFDKDIVTRAMDLLRSARLSRDLYSRYIILWTALDMLGGHLSLKSRKKTNSMATTLGPLRGYEDNLPDTLYTLYTIRNDIEHARRNDVDFPVDCKKQLFILENVLQSVLRKKFGLQQKPLVQNDNTSTFKS